jgi:hypothetical protein
MGPVIETFSGVFDGPLTWTNAVFSRPGGEAVFFLEGENVVFDGGYNGGGGYRVLLVHNCELPGCDVMDVILMRSRLFGTRR